jgi:O-antigen ligase
VAFVRSSAEPGRLATLSACLLSAILVSLLVGTDRWASAILPMAFWAGIGLAEVPFRLTIVVPLLVLIATGICWSARKAPDVPALLAVTLLIALQTNGIKFGPVDLIFCMPFVVMLYVLAESLKDPSFQIVLPGVVFFGFLLLLLSLPYMATPHVYPMSRFIVNFISFAKGMLVAFAVVNVLRTKRHLDLAVRAFIAVAVVSALIGIGQIVLNYFTGLMLSMTLEEAETKPNFLGTTMRATGLTTWASWLSDFLMLAVPFVLFRLFTAERLRRRLLYLAAMLILLAGIFFTFTYAAYFAVAVMFALFPFVYWPHRSVHFVLALLLAAGIFQLAGGFKWLYDDALTKVAQSAGMVERRSYLRATLNEVARNPWVGSGIYAEEEFSENFYRKRAHNAGLQAWADLGLAGLLIFVTMMLTVLTQVWLMASSLRGPDRHLFQALGLGVIASIVTMFAEPNLTLAITWFHLGFCQSALLIYCTFRYPRPWAASAGAAVRSSP